MSEFSKFREDVSSAREMILGKLSDPKYIGSGALFADIERIREWQIECDLEIVGMVERLSRSISGIAGSLASLASFEARVGELERLNREEVSVLAGRVELIEKWIECKAAGVMVQREGDFERYAEMDEQGAGGESEDVEESRG